MNVQTILLSVLGIIITTFVSWALERLIAFINAKLKDTKYAQYLTDAVDIVSRAVKNTYQTYVQSLKDKDMFTSEAQNEALKKAKDMAMSQLSDEIQNYITSNFGDVEQWLSSTIESVLYDLKNKK